MRRNNWFGTALFVFCVLFIAVGLIFVKWPDFQHKNEVDRVLHSASILEVSLSVQYAKPPIYRETYAMRDDNGVSNAQYQARSFTGKIVTLKLLPEKTYAVSFFFQELVQDGIWDLTSKPPRGTNITYTLHVHQVAGAKQGSRTITFTDPAYWALEAGRQFHIVLNPHKAVPDLTTLKGTSLADPRYLKIVQAFRDFGPPEFRARVARARESASKDT